MKSFEFFAAKDSNHAVALLAQHAANAKVKIIAGGTDLLADLKFAAHGPDVVVDISRADDLKNITITEQGLNIGALVTHTQIMRSPLICQLFPALVDAAHTIGAVQTRNLGTLGGNLVTAVPSMDSGPTLIALGAVATKVIRAPQAEAYLEGRAITPEAIAEAGRVAVGDAEPISDFRASAEYRRHLVAVLTKRALEGAWALAQTRRLEGSNGKRNA